MARAYLPPGPAQGNAKAKGVCDGPRPCRGAAVSAPLSRRMKAKLRLALLGDCGCPDTIGALAAEASAEGLTGAEIDTALAGRSFEARADAAIAYACAIRSGAPGARAAARARGLRLGLSQSELAALDEAVRAILAGARR